MAEEPQQAIDLYPDGTADPGSEQYPKQLALPLDMNGERWVTDPRHYAGQLHSGGRGTVALAHRNAGRWLERTYPVEAAVAAANAYRGRADVYLSTQRFRGRRRLATLLSLSSFYADLDYYRIPELAGLHPYHVLEGALALLEARGIPPPTLAISSGRGLYLVWQHEHVKRSALPRWRAVQSEITRALLPHGADPQATDAARVLRMVGTTNQDEPVYSLLPVGEVYEFNKLADRVLPMTQAEIHDLRVQRALRASRKPEKRSQAPPEGFTGATLWEARLTDLQRLRELRFMDAQMTDYRHRWLFVAGVGMSWLASSPYAMRRELFELAAEAGSWSEDHTAGKLSSVVNRTKRAFAGERVEWRGEMLDPRYRLTNQRIIEWLEIDASEESHMRTLLSSDERRRRDRERKDPEMSRGEYEGRASQRREDARRMAAEGLTHQQIGQALGVTRSAVSKMLKDKM
ncbi:hypothetical protein [Rubrobacter aplysinae]|uniref:hypothetical protein n=1 Tax=Rubrobacter aplysinae TaxID=909625 RepID=UPI00064C1503|nr:hypothetical protein [Rubrobacter aplysinae]